VAQLPRPPLRTTLPAASAPLETCMAPPKDFDFDKFKKLVPKSVAIPSNMKTNMTFLNVHYIHYPKLSKSSKVQKVMDERVNQIRQMVPGLKKTRDNINTMFDALKPNNKEHDKFKLVLMQYLELLRKAERDRQQWIKDERDLGNGENVKTNLEAQGADDVIRI
jgi:hypothetical protein